jgi:hypothetical protein
MAAKVLIRFDFSRVLEAIALIDAVLSDHPGFTQDVMRRIEDGEQPVVINTNWVVDPSDGARLFLVEPAPWLAHLASSARAAAGFTAPGISLADFDSSGCLRSRS